jgi:hypothetical protein
MWNNRALREQLEFGMLAPEGHRPSRNLLPDAALRLAALRGKSHELPDERHAS